LVVVVVVVGLGVVVVVEDVGDVGVASATVVVAPAPSAVSGLSVAGSSACAGGATDAPSSATAAMVVVSLDARNRRRPATGVRVDSVRGCRAVRKITNGGIGTCLSSVERFLAERSPSA
jgi:hypothetical protein